MEGALYKWYGPFSRWQLRYCVVNNGQLEFYSSKQSLVEGQPCLESHHISFCDITVDKKSPVDWSMQVPCHPIIYLKAESKEERQRWFRILGSAKACLTNTSALNVLTPHDKITIETSQDSINGSPIVNSSEISSPTSTQDKQVSEKILDVEPAQISSQNSPTISGIVQEQNNVDNTKSGEKNEHHDTEFDVDEIFLQNLGTICDDMKTDINSFQQRYCSNINVSVDSLHKDAGKLSSLFSKFTDLIQSVTGKPLDASICDDTCSNQSESGSQLTIDSGYAVSFSHSTTKNSTTVVGRIKLTTFFNNVKVSFRDVMNEANQCSSSNLLSNVKSETYMTACIEYTKFFDLFAGTLLSPLKNDILSNAEKIRKEFVKDPEKYVYLQPIFEDEITRQGHLHSDSATQAVLWMMRGLRTMSAFFKYVTTPEHHAYKVAGTAFELAYREHLRPHHNFVVQRMFTMGLKLIPGFDHFKKQVVIGDADLNSPEIEEEILNQAQEYCQAMSEVVESIEKIYIHHSITLEFPVFSRYILM